ncbi:MAG TPA: aconitase X catalytic domain-containing protein [Nitrososphaeraceae archaeon]|nr:aconitase X catalytic domain-containing protein [Nitrososphaeraceae archaeon]
MDLTREEEDALDGKNGNPISTAYKILLSIGIATNAEKLIPVEWVHLSGVNYNTIGDAGVEFLTKYSEEAEFVVPTTINPMGYDSHKQNNLSSNFQKQQSKIAKAYEKMGSIPSFSCIPYELFQLPKSGHSVSFAESNAAVMANSVFGLRTNKESSLSALASAITGKAPYSDLRMDSTRDPKIRIKIDKELKTELDYGVLGYFSGKSVKESCVSFGPDISNIDMYKTKSLSAALGTSGTCGMFSSRDTHDETISFGKEEEKSVIDELNTTDSGDVIALGSPQLGMYELELLSKMITGKKFSKKCMIFCARSVYEKSCKSGMAKILENAGANIICDACTCLSPLLSREEYDGVITNSVKAAHYLNKSNGVSVCLKDLKSIVMEYAK